MMLKFPSAINFLHFAVVPLACCAVLLKAKSKDRTQLANSIALLGSLLILLTIFFASSLLNNAGFINLFLSYLMWTEPFILILAIIAIPMTPKAFNRFRKWILGFAFFNVGFALIQKFLLKWDTCNCSPGGWGDGDAIKGVFINQGSGHVVSASVCASIGIYFYITAKDRPMWQRIIALLAGISNIIWSQANQVVVVMAGGFALLSLINMKDVLKALSYLVGITVFGLLFAWAIYNVPGLESFQTWIRPEIYGPDGEATQFKLSGIRIVIEHFHSPLNLWLGLGPGHTIDRLGGWMLRDFSDLLSPLGSTKSPVADEVWRFMGNSWLANGSSFFAPFFGWAAIWGDLGFLGLGAYLYVCWITWTRICPDDLSKYLILTVAIQGFIFTQMQEPGYMIFIASLIGLRWQELRQYSYKHFS
ncbi:hypothetical protein [Brunnivagina elsteri]|nr:hypothetical protein [Calothrix elsteri]